MLFNRVDVEQESKPVSLPKLDWLEKVPPDDAKEIAKRFATERVIKTGRDAWDSITKAETFTAWKSIAAALAIGRDHALRVSGANAAWGRNYSRAFCDWSRQHGFDRMPSSVLSVAIELNENISAIESWRATLTDKERWRCVHPLSNVRRWRAQNKTKCSDNVSKAAAAWRRFVACVEALPPEQAAPFWRAIENQARAAGALTI